MKAISLASLLLVLLATFISGCCHRASCKTGTEAASKASVAEAAKHLKIGIVLKSSDAETVFNAFRYANYALGQGDTVMVFLLGKGVDLEKISDRKFDAKGQARDFAKAGGKIAACGTCLTMHNLEESALCPISTMADMYQMIAASDRVLTF